MRPTTTASRAYAILCDYYLGSNRAQKITSLKELLRLVLLPHETIIQFTSRVDRIRDTLAIYKLKDDDLIIECVLTALPSAFDTFSVVVNTNENHHSWDKFKLKLHNFSDSKFFNSNKTNPSQIMSLRDGSNYGHISGNQHHTGAIPKVVAPKLGNTVHPRAVNAAPTDTGNMPRPTINKPKPKKFKKPGKSLKKCMLCLGRSHKTEECRSKKF